MTQFKSMLCGALLGAPVMAALLFLASLHTNLWPSPEEQLRVDVDVWAGLSTPHVVPKESADDRKRAEAKVCLAQVVYGEARGERWEGQVAVAQVVLRRAGLDWRHACYEAHKPSQFAPAGAPRSHAAWQWALAAADEALQWSATEGTDYSRGATFFHSGERKPYWVRGLEQVALIGGHAFYR